MRPLLSLAYLLYDVSLCPANVEAKRKHAKPDDGGTDVDCRRLQI